MELKFQSKPISFLKSVVQEVQNSEQTQEIKLSDSMPDIGRVVSAWGQPILRGKEWRSDEISFSGGMMVWVLYLPEEDGQPQTISSWVPFHLRWDMQPTRQEGTIRISCVNRFADARSVSPRKLMLRCGMGVLAEAYLPDSAESFLTGAEEPGIELLRKLSRKRLNKHGSEKTFVLDEELAMPDSLPAPEQIVYAALDPKLQECRVLTDKLVFRGRGMLHVLFRGKDGDCYSRDFELPFSQYTELESDFTGDAAADVRFGVTNLEPELTESGNLRVKAGMVAQYLISDTEPIELVEDAYGLDRELELKTEDLILPVAGEKVSHVLTSEQSVQTESGRPVDCRFLPDFPQLRRSGDQLQLLCSGNLQMLCLGEDGELRNVSSRWEDQIPLEGDPDREVRAYSQSSEPQLLSGNGSMLIKTEHTVEHAASSQQRIPMVTQIQPGQLREKEKDRPSLILQRMGEESLWEIAKENRTTVAAIRSANDLEGEPAPGQMLLIPVQ